MQPLVSPVDHESRHNSYRASDGDAAEISESTPLVRRFPPSSAPQGRSPLTTAVVSLLLLVLMMGVIIGIYLLVIQNSQEHILPPVESSLMYVGRMRWDNGWHPPLGSHPLLGLVPLAVKAKYVVAVQTDTSACSMYSDCVALIRKLQASLKGKELPYNFLVSSNGEVFEATSWRPSPYYPQYPRALVLAFIGNFTESPPSPAQMTGAEKFFTFSVSQQHLLPDFKIVGNDTQYEPKYLYQVLQKYPQWGESASVRHEP